MTKELFADVIKAFTTEWKAKNGDLPAFLLGDQVPSHNCPKTVGEALLNSIHLISLPANTTHFLQPLDDVCFSTFKNKIKSNIKNQSFVSAFSNKRKLSDIMKEVQDAEIQAFTPEVIRASFERTGIWPFEKRRILERTYKNSCIFSTEGKNEMKPDLMKCLEAVQEMTAKQVEEEQEMEVKTAIVSKNKCYDSLSANKLMPPSSKNSQKRDQEQKPNSNSTMAVAPRSSERSWRSAPIKKGVKKVRKKPIVSHEIFFNFFDTPHKIDLVVLDLIIKLSTRFNSYSTNASSNKDNQKKNC